VGEVDDFREFVIHRSPSLSRTAYLLTGDHQLAEDLLQSALARVYPHWRRVREGNPEAYVRRVMYHQHISWWRRHRPPERLEPDPRDHPGPDPNDGTALRLAVTAALRRLSRRQHAVLLLRYYEDLTEAQVAELLGCTVGSVKRHAYEGLRRLRAIAPDLVESLPERSPR
jgi:RNA polymerase sigma-70 factor (sigma-E family)